MILELPVDEAGRTGAFAEWMKKVLKEKAVVR